MVKRIERIYTEFKVVSFESRALLTRPEVRQVEALREP
jgi:hypothetical protein